MNNINALKLLHGDFTNKALVLLIALMSIFLLIPKASQAFEVTYDIPNHIIYEITDPNGFMSVQVNVDFGDLGNIDVVSHTFPKCTTTATVSWDIIVPNFQIFVSPCDSGFGSLVLNKQEPFSKIRSLDFEIVPDESSRSLSALKIRPVVLQLSNDDIVVPILQEECQWTNDNVAQCLVWDCDSEEICVEYGSYCVDHNAKTIPCP